MQALSRPSMRPFGRCTSSISEQISALEGNADDMHDTGLRESYLASTANNNAIAFFVGIEVYDHLEKVVDRFDDVANTLQRHCNRTRVTSRRSWK